MAKVNITIESTYRDMIASSILNLVREHRLNCTNSDCGVTLFPFRELIEQLFERPLTKEEKKLLS